MNHSNKGEGEVAKGGILRMNEFWNDKNDIRDDPTNLSTIGLLNSSILRSITILLIDSFEILLLIEYIIASNKTR